MKCRAVWFFMIVALFAPAAALAGDPEPAAQNPILLSVPIAVTGLPRDAEYIAAPQVTIGQALPAAGAKPPKRQDTPPKS